MRGCSACLWCGVVRWLPLATDRRTATLCSWPIFPHTRCLIHAPMHPCTTLYGRLKRLEATNCMLDAFNIECSEELALAMNRFQNHTRTLIQAKNDLHSIFRRIRWVEYQAGRGGVYFSTIAQQLVFARLASFRPQRPSHANRSAVPRRSTA